MVTKTIILAAVALQAVAATATLLSQRQESCDAVRIFIARGSDEPYPGRQSKLADAICDGLESCGSEDIVYPATFSDYCYSAFEGVLNGTAQILAYVQRCPDVQLVLTGYSQGAHVVGDILGGGGGIIPDQNCSQLTSPGLPRTVSPGNQIVAATLFGDVRHTANQTYNVGTGAAGSGIWPRENSQLSSLNVFSESLHSWCLVDDPVCAGGDDVDAHTSYFDVFISEAATWVKTKL
ncbi:carbohydrate esterase family 5 protein [Xylariaceae sp. FL0662B]|nr:carbohydrate esterase family 5 protein [Xylariaceae sp. FL0662B]